MTRRRLLAGLAVLFVVLAATLRSPTAALSRLEWLVTEPLRFGLALCLVALVRPLLAWPTTLLAVGVGYGYGVVGVPFALALITVTSVPPFLLAGRFGRGSRVGRAGERVVGEVGGVRSVVASRLLPTPSDVVNVAAGVSGVSLRTFVAGTAVGELPWAVVGVLAGASLSSLSTASLGGLFDLRLVAAAGLAALLLLAGPAYRTLVGSDPVTSVADVE